MAASWECPSLPMLSLPLKESVQTTFLGIKPMISAHYEEDGDSFHEEIKQLDSLRQTALRPPKDYNGVSMLRRYFGQLHLIRERFPPETIGQLPIDFAWKDAYTEAQYVQEGLQIEQASILYNISALHSMLGCRVKRTAEHEMKEAMTHFQCAAGAYTYLDEHFSVNHVSKDLSPQYISLYKDLMLGQAQECLVEKGLKGAARVKNTAIAKLAVRVSEYYSNVLRLLETEPCIVIAKKHKDWPRLLKIKVFYFQAVSHFYQGSHAEEQGRQGELIAWLTLSLQKLTAIGKIPKSLGDLREAAKNFFDHVNDRLAVVKRQNDQVYHDRVPEPDILEQVTGADLVKPIAFQAADPKNVGRDIFARLVPMRAYEAASVYSEEKAKLLRSVVSSAQEKDDELEQYLLSLNAGEINQLTQNTPSIPDEVLQKHRQMEGKSALVKKLHSDIQELMKLSDEVSDDLTLISEKRKEDANNEDIFQSRQGRRSPSQIMAGLWKETDNLSKFHMQASKSNAELKVMFDQHYQYLLLLSGPIATLQAAVPKLTALDTPVESSQDSERWKELMAKIDEMKKQRKALVGQLRDQINRDDITKTLIGHLGSDKEVFIDEQMRQHREIADIIRKNLDAQDNILRAVTEANAKKAQVRETVQELTQQQESMFASLVKAGATFALLQSKISEGLGFYTRLHGNMTKLRKRVLDVVAARQSERESTERRRTPDRSRSPTPDPSHHNIPPPRPPKKAEFTGNPIAPEQQLLPNDPQHQLQPPAGDQASPAVGPTHQSVTPPTQTAGQSLEEQLQELQRQQQMQLQALQNMNISSSGGLDLKAVQNIVPPNQSLTDLQIQSEPQPSGMLMTGVPSHPSSDQQIIQSPVSPPGIQTGQVSPLELPAQQVLSPGMPTQQVPPSKMLTQQILPPTPSTQQDPSIMPAQHLSSHVTDPPLADLLGTNTSSQTELLQAPLEPVDSVSQDTMRAIQDLQLLLQPPGGEDNVGESVKPPQIEQPSPSDQGGTGEEIHTNTNETQETRPQNETAFIKPSLPVIPSIPVESVPKQVATGVIEVPLPRESGEVEAPLENGDSPAGGGEGQIEPGSTLPDVLQATTGPGELEKPGLDIANSFNVWGEQFLQTSDIAPTQTVNENTITINSISRPIPAPIQSPPSTQSHAPLDTLGTPEQTPSHLDVQEHILPPNVAEAPINQVQIDDKGTAHLPSEPVGFQPIADLVSSLEEPRMSEDVSHRAEIDTALELVPHTQPLSIKTTPNTQPTLSQTDSHPMQSDLSSLPAVISQHPQPTLTSEDPSEPPLSTSMATIQIVPAGNLNSQIEPPLTSNTVSAFIPIVTNNLPALGSSNNNLSSAVPSLAQMPESVSTIQAMSVPTSVPFALTTPPAISPLPPELTMPLQDYHTLTSTTSTLPHFDSSHFEAQLAKKDEQIEELKAENDNQRAQNADQRLQIESYKQQLLLLQQQVAQVTVQQQKHEQEKVASSGQQAILMQLLQQQQGMFSQQQTQLENMSKVTEAHRKEQQELESTYKQALAVEREQKSTLQHQLMQQTQEMQRLNQQLQSQAQQYQNLQIQLHQYHTQIQERDKQIVDFREQHKNIVQGMKQKYEQKISQLMQQLQEHQTEIKKLRTQRQMQGIMTPLQPMPTQQFISQQQQVMRPPTAQSISRQMPPVLNTPLKVSPNVNVPRQLPPNANQQMGQIVSFPGQVPPNPAPPKVATPNTQQQGYTQPIPDTPRTLQHQPLVPQPALRQPPNQSQNYPGGPGQPLGLAKPLQPSPAQGYGRQEPQQRILQGQNFQSPQPGPGGTQTFQASPGQLPTSQPGGLLMRQDSQSFRPEQPPSEDGQGVPPASSFGFMPHQDQNWQQQTPGQASHGPQPQLPLQQFQSPGGQFQQGRPGFTPQQQQQHSFTQHKPM